MMTRPRRRRPPVQPLRIVLLAVIAVLVGFTGRSYQQMAKQNARLRAGMLAGKTDTKKAADAKVIDDAKKAADAKKKADEKAARAEAKRTDPSKPLRWLRVWAGLILLGYGTKLVLALTCDREWWQTVKEWVKSRTSWWLLWLPKAGRWLLKQLRPVVNYLRPYCKGADVAKTATIAVVAWYIWLGIPQGWVTGFAKDPLHIAQQVACHLIAWAAILLMLGVSKGRPQFISGIIFCLTWMLLSRYGVKQMCAVGRLASVVTAVAALLGFGTAYVVYVRYLNRQIWETAYQARRTAIQRVMTWTIVGLVVFMTLLVPIGNAVKATLPETLTAGVFEEGKGTMYRGVPRDTFYLTDLKRGTARSVVAPADLPKGSVDLDGLKKAIVGYTIQLGSGKEDDGWRLVSDLDAEGRQWLEETHRLQRYADTEKCTGRNWVDAASGRPVPWRFCYEHGRRSKPGKVVVKGKEIDGRVPAEPLYQVKNAAIKYAQSDYWDDNGRIDRDERGVPKKVNVFDVSLYDQTAQEVEWINEVHNLYDPSLRPIVRDLPLHLPE